MRSWAKRLGQSVVLLSALCAACVANSGDDAQGASRAAAPGDTAPHGRQQLSGQVTAEMASAPIVGRVPPETPLHLSIALPPRHRDEIKQRIRAIADPSDPSYRKYITPEQYAEAYGPDQADYDAVTEWARSRGLTVERTFSNRVVVSVTGTTEAVEKALYVSMTRRTRADGTQFFAPDREPSLDLGVPVQRVEGLNDFAPPRPAQSASCPVGERTMTLSPPLICVDFTGPYTPQNLRSAYLGNDTSCSTLTGAGQSIGLIEFAGFDPNDLAAYGQAMGLPEPTISTPLDNWAGNSPNDQEVSGDIEMAWGMAPGATIVVLESGGLFNILATVATREPLINQISESWFDNSYSESIQDLVDELALQGQSYFLASGDYGGYTSRSSDDMLNATGITVVGGTQLGMLEGGYGGEMAWSMGSVTQGSGGGYLGPAAGTAGTGIPYYQDGLSANGSGASSWFRNLPDVAMPAASAIYYTSGGTEGTPYLAYFGGTSMATPLYAGIMALVNQQNPGSPVGFANPALYALSASNPSYFNQITQTNEPVLFPLAAGYNMVTGLGSPTCGLINALGEGGQDHAQVALPSGFKTFGGAVSGPWSNLCLGPAGDVVGAGVRLVSETCSSSPAQNWVVSYKRSYSSISPATNPNLCIDGNPTTQTVVLNECDGSPTQTWTVGNNIVLGTDISTDGPGLCLDVLYGGNVSGTTIDVTTCNETESQDFWPWGFPLTFMNAAGDQCLNNVADGVTMNDAVCRPTVAAPPLPETFILTKDNEILTSTPLPVGNENFGPACVTLNQLGAVNGPYYSYLSTQVCGVGYEVGSAQTWDFVQGGVHAGAYSWATIRSTTTASDGSPECVDVQGGSYSTNTPVDVYKCNQTPAQAWQVSLLSSDYVGFSGY